MGKEMEMGIKPSLPKWYPDIKIALLVVPRAERRALPKGVAQKKE